MLGHVGTRTGALMRSLALELAPYFIRANTIHPAAPEDRTEPVEHLAGERGELRTAMVDRRGCQRPQDAVGHVGRTGDLQEVPSAAVAHRILASFLASFRHWERGT
jgi:NAD(P)-dependent dehydrogenase (short-subunit alcohol dehydrogenase family)